MFFHVAASRARAGGAGVDGWRLTRRGGSQVAVAEEVVEDQEENDDETEEPAIDAVELERTQTIDAASPAVSPEPLVEDVNVAPRVTEQGLFDDALGLFSPDDTSEIADLLSLA